jgi:hypothetical protein
MKRILLTLLGALGAQAASAGVYVELVDHDLASGKVELSQRMYVQNGQGRFVDSAGRTTLIKNGTMYVIDDSDKSYIAFDKATMDKLAVKLNEAMSQMQEQLAKLPPEQRAQMEAMLPNMSGGDQKWEVEAIDTGKSDKVDGRSCRVWDVKRNGELDDQMCVVPYGSLPGKENFQAMFANFAKVFEEMAKSVPMLSGMMSNEFAAQEKINGFPVRSRDYENGKLSDVERLMSVWRDENIPAATFEIPAGYRKKSMEEMAGQ